MRLRRICLWVLALTIVTRVFSQQAKVAQAWSAQTIHWPKTDADGTKWAVLEGRDDLPGQAFTYAAFIPAGFHDRHSHSSDARVAVVQGALKIGFGSLTDLNHLTTYQVGAFLFVRQTPSIRWQLTSTP